MSRRRIARLLERFSLFVFGPYVEVRDAWPQERIDATLEQWARDSDHAVNIVRRR